jgi:hypothetical protein
MRKLVGLAICLVGVCGCARENARVVTRMNVGASLTRALPWNPLRGSVVTSWIDPKASTMSTLYGNDVAVAYARTNTEHVYPAGSMLSLVTWTQQEDERWYGAKIPAAPESVEFVMVGSTAEKQPIYSYQEFRGKPLTRVSAVEGPAPNERVAYLLAQRAAVMP